MMHLVMRGVASSLRASTSASSPYPCRRKVFVDMPNALSRSNNQCRENSIAASLPSDSTRPSRRQKKISKHERRAIVESFVDKYRATNAGKFPTVSHTRKETGGSHYTVREIIQELEYKSKFPHVKEAEEFPLEKIKEEMYTSSDARKEPSLTKAEEVSVPVSSESCTYHDQSLELPASFNKVIMNGIKVDDNPENVTEAQGSPITCSHSEKTCDESSVYSNQTKGSPSVLSYDTKDSTTEVVNPIPPSDPVKQLQEGLENSSNPLPCMDSDHDSSGGKGLQDSSATHVAVSSLKVSDSDPFNVMGSIGSHNSGIKPDIREDMPKSFPEEPYSCRGVDGQKGIEEKHGQELSRTGDHRGITRKSEQEEASPEGSTVWRNLKSLARGIISFWKKT